VHWDQELARALALDTIPRTARAAASAGPVRAGDVVMEAVRAQVVELRAQDPRVRRDLPDSVTQMRVATRQLRSILTGYTRILDSQRTTLVAEELKWLGAQLAEEHDTEVMIERFNQVIQALPDNLIVGPLACDIEQALGQLAEQGEQTIMAALTMSVGNIVAIVQNNVKRMLAYSSIAHAGYALVGFVAAGAATDPEQRNAALTSVTFYLLTYAVMNMGAFAIITLIARGNDRHNEVDDYNGIGFLSPVLAFSLSLFLLSLLGMPLTAGFMGKVMVFTNAVRQGYVWLVVIGVLNTAISAYYYLRLIVVMFFRERNAPWDPPPIRASIAVALVLTIASVFYLGLFPQRIIRAFGSRPTTSVLVR